MRNSACDAGARRCEDPIGLSYSTPVTIWVQRSEDRINRHNLLAPTGKRRLVTAHTQCRHFASRQERQARPLVVGCSTETGSDAGKVFLRASSSASSWRLRLSLSPSS